MWKSIDRWSWTSLQPARVLWTLQQEKENQQTSGLPKNKQQPECLQPWQDRRIKIQCKTQFKIQPQISLWWRWRSRTRLHGTLKLCKIGLKCLNFSGRQIMSETDQAKIARLRWKACWTKTKRNCNCPQRQSLVWSCAAQVQQSSINILLEWRAGWQLIWARQVISADRSQVHQWAGRGRCQKPGKNWNC